MSSTCSACPSQTTPDFATQTVLKGLINRTSSHSLLKAAGIIFFAGGMKKKLWVSDFTLKKIYGPNGFETNITHIRSVCAASTHASSPHTTF